MVTEGSEYYFDPIGLFVEPEETVTFEIDSGSHSLTAYKEENSQASVTHILNGAESWDREVLSEENTTSEHTLDTTGTYDFFCTPHKTLRMVGRIVAGEPGSPADGSMPPDGMSRRVRRLLTKARSRTAPSLGEHPLSVRS